MDNNASAIRPAERVGSKLTRDGVIKGMLRPPRSEYQNPYRNYDFWYKGAIHAHTSRVSASQPPEEAIRKH